MVAVSGLAARPAAFWSLGFRPFFLATGLWAPAALAVWIGLFVTGETLPSRFDPLTWHLHAMLFGFTLAAMAGFLLTAIPNWTGRRPVRGGLLVALVTLWLAGRAACLVSEFMPLWLAASLDLAFPVALAAVAAWEIVAARNWRNVMIPVPVALLGVADLLIYLDLAGWAVPAGFGWRLALVMIVILISVIGGRIIPAFTRNWLVGRGVRALPGASGWPDRLALATLHAGLMLWAVSPAWQAVGPLLVLAAACNLWRLGRWRGLATTAEPLLAILHLGYFWLAIGTGLLGASLLVDRIPETAAIHALTAGAIGTMILAVMTRVARGHTGRPLKADHATTASYALITVAAAARVTAAFWSGASIGLLELSSVLWVAAFGLFVWIYGPMLWGPRVEAAR